MVGEDGVWRLSQVGADSELIAHGAAQDQQTVFFARKVGDKGFEGQGGRVFAEDIIKKSGLLDGAEHGGGGSGDNIA